jgi:hypothetical protein
MNVAKLDAVDIDLSSHHAQSTPGEGSWSVSFNNLPALKQTRELFVSKVSVPNVHGNVNKYSQSFSILDANFAVVETKIVPEGHYDAATLASLLNTAYATWTYSTTTYKFSLTTTASVTGQQFYIEANLDFFELVGFADQLIEVDNDRTFLHRYALGGSPLVTTEGHLPNLSGTTVFHILAHNRSPNTFESADGRIHDVIYSGMFDANSPYGFYKTYECPDRRIQSVSFRTPMNFSSVRLSLVDHRMRPIPLPPNYHVFVICRAYHTDTYHS